MQSQEITSENKEEDEKRQQFTDNAFGTNPQPVLERVEFKVCIKVILVIFDNYYQTIISLKHHSIARSCVANGACCNLAIFAIL